VYSFSCILLADTETTMATLTDYELDKIFNAFDANGDGVLDVSELIHFIKALKKTEDKVNVDKVLKMWDENKDFQISPEEFKKRMSAYCKKHPEGRGILESAALQKYMGSHIGGLSNATAAKASDTFLSDADIMRIFAAFDKNGDGMLEISELLYFIKELKNKDKLNVEKILKKWDPSGDKQVTQDEFKQRMNEYVVQLPEGKDILKSAALSKYQAGHVGELPSAGPSPLLVGAAIAAVAVAAFAFYRSRK